MASKGAEAMRRYRERHPERARAANREAQARHRERHPERIRARRKIAKAVERGKLERGTCEVCGAEAEAHHEDYSKPYDVRWLCKAHHEEVHHVCC